MIEVFQGFSKAIGIYVHPGKCKLYFGGVSPYIRHEIVGISGFTEGCLPFKYLGVPLSSRKLTINQCRPLVEKIIVLPIPQKVTKEIDAIYIRYLWSGTDIISREALIAWEKVGEPRNSCGLNITLLRMSNKATIGKLLWNIHMKVDRLWIQWLDMYFLKGVDIMQWQVTTTSSWNLKHMEGHTWLVANYKISSEFE
ncbi:uncharacterized protein LOC131621819 [Vicia villosa]|uniref:uncharacterized protein LOC131621819 n=1 Tax=Vicia villosa TaxID=3911 RepID=UPI00273C3CA6|nr:uncharacterized protein LOC131621819 [Vicia villosa]